MNKTTSRSLFSAAAFVLALATCAGQASAGLISRVTALTGGQVVGPINTPASGCGRFIIDTDANTISFRMTIANLTGGENSATLHFAAPGANGAQILNFPLGLTKSGVVAYPQAIESALLNGNTYVLIRTGGFAGGEIRGQICTSVALIDAQQEVPANASPAQGVGIFNLDSTTGIANYYIIFNGLVAAETVAHIHGFANIGTNTGVLFGLPVGSPKVGSVALTAAQQKLFVDGLAYVNIHSAAFPNGEIRGQIVSSVNPIDSQQEVPANASPANGCGFCAINVGGDVLSYDIRRTTLAGAETVHHIHGFAPAGFNAGVLVNLPAGPRKLGTYAYPAATEVSILNELSYINLHSNVVPSGEIRGQIRFPCALDFVTRPADEDVCEGSPLVLSALAAGTDTITYQWKKGLLDVLPVVGRISGTISPNLAFTPTIPSDSGVYTCVIRNTCGTITSRNVTVLVRPLTDTTCILCPACPADYNQDGGVTGDDIAAFFADYEAGTGCADTNVDGGITGDDIAAFFVAYEAGGC